MSIDEEADTPLSSIVIDSPQITDADTELETEDSPEFITKNTAAPLLEHTDEEDSFHPQTLQAQSLPKATQLVKKKKTAPQPGVMTATTSQAGDRGPQGENTGRWTAEEHSLFLQGLEQHGKGWKKIGALALC